MDYQQIAVAFHLIGFALGLGGATISDITFFKIVRSGSLSAERFQFLHTLSKVIWVGLGLLIASGLTIFALIYSENGSLPMLTSPRWQAKLTLVGVVLLNGLFFKFHIFPALKQLIDQTFNKDNIGRLANKLALSGTISILSWYSILVITLLPRAFRPHLIYFFTAYLVLLIIGFLFSKTILNKIISQHGTNQV